LRTTAAAAAADATAQSRRLQVYGGSGGGASVASQAGILGTTGNAQTDQDIAAFFSARDSFRKS